ncbi:Sugar phosphatase YfbT [Corynebacterium atrinae]|uniref:HAD-IA family hydrolase n=1 Tax=Corynebacterium atrinae TaxID=1336740 RepID=UPI0025B5C57B|nr:HAD-IA family hydrolase [Corynebacterium atrinae]WJY63256.1 Sugar phosphatase YfbT [Corynebacterium atrinae]
MKYDAILFDIDGTLVDSTPAVEKVWRTWAASAGVDADAIMAVSHGRRTRDTLAEFIPEEDIDQALADMRVVELAELHSVTALPGVRNLLTTLPPERWAAVTSGDRELMVARLEASEVPVPEILIDADDVATGKPDPEGYLLAAARLGFEPSRCLVVEDAPAGLKAGRAAGGGVLAVATSHPARELAGLGDAVVDTLLDVDFAIDDDGITVTSSEQPRPS